jgi:hypothetical protein
LFSKAFLEGTWFEESFDVCLFGQAKLELQVRDLLEKVRSDKSSGDEKKVALKIHMLALFTCAAHAA